MNVSQHVQTNAELIKSVVAGFRAASEGALDSANYSAPSGNSTLERFRQNTSRKERFLYSTRVESDNVLKTDDDFDDEDNCRDPHRAISIHRASHAAVGEFLGVVAHKWRQPLNSITLTIHNIVDAWKYGEMNDELLERSELRIMEQITQLTRTIDDFRSFLDPDTTTEFFNPAESMKSVVTQLSKWFDGTSVITISVTDEPDRTLQVLGCQHAFERVIVNLLCNANDAIEELQRVSDNTFSGLITISLMFTGENIVINFEDNGGGIDESRFTHIFEPYFTTKQKTKGFGMGLYLSKLVIEDSMNGKIWHENITEGARFSIMLPATSGERMSK